VRALAIDFGERRIGLAVSDPSGTLARPLATLERRGSDEAAAAEVARVVARLAAEEGGLETIVIGWPRRLDGGAHPFAARVERFARALAARVAHPIVYQDERLSSREAETRLAERERDWRRRKRVLDAASAAVILQDYLDERARARAGGAGEPPGACAPEAPEGG
jgi:putative Holliday junction resolvase